MTIPRWCDHNNGNAKTHLADKARSEAQHRQTAHEQLIALGEPQARGDSIGSEHLKGMIGHVRS
jgi:hypothetical protein